MAEEQPVDEATEDQTEEAQSEEPEIETESPSSEKLVRVFCKLSGYTKADILAYAVQRRTVVTKNGSKYQVSKNGKQLKILSGAVPPAATEV